MRQASNGLPPYETMSTCRTLPNRLGNRTPESKTLPAYCPRAHLTRSPSPAQPLSIRARDVLSSSNSCSQSQSASVVVVASPGHNNDIPLIIFRSRTRSNQHPQQIPRLAASRESSTSEGVARECDRRARADNMQDERGRMRPGLGGRLFPRCWKASQPRRPKPCPSAASRPRLARGRAGKSGFQGGATAKSIRCAVGVSKIHWRLIKCGWLITER